MSYKRILTIQDISCLGQCSGTVALPVLSACGHESCIIPTAVLSTHTGQFKGYTLHDLSEDIPAITAHLKRENMLFDAVYVGYISSARQAEYIERAIRELLAPGGLVVLDPAMADNGKLYSGLDEDCISAMGRLCSLADIILPNITEACLLTGQEYRESYDERYICSLLKGLSCLGSDRVILTGVSFEEEHTGVMSSDRGNRQYYRHKRIPRMFHGTGDVFASAFVGGVVRGLDFFDAAVTAAKFTIKSIEYTLDDPEHWYGVKFEKALPWLTENMEQV